MECKIPYLPNQKEGIDFPPFLFSEIKSEDQSVIFDDRHGLKLYFAALGDMLAVRSKIRTPEQRSKKMINEEMTIMNLQMAIKKEEFKKNLKTKPGFHEGYMKVDVKVKDRPPHDCWLSTSDVDVNDSFF